MTEFTDALHHTPGRFIKKPIAVEAMQNTGRNTAALLEWGGGKVRYSNMPRTPASMYLVVESLEGTLVCHKGDWVVKGPNGEYWPVDGEIFAETYEGAPPSGSA